MSTRLSSSIAGLGGHYDVVVVGSGYGGSIAASRFARARKSVCLLERGREFLPGDFPADEDSALAEVQVDTEHGTLFNPNGLYHFIVGDDLNVFKGCGLGGTSLVNANVSLRADKRVFLDERWPAGLRIAATTDALDRDLEEGFTRALAMLRPLPYPEDRPSPRKLRRLGEAMSNVSGELRRTPINVSFEAQLPNQFGVEQHACTGCGDCVTGCNVGAKNTTAMNYLPDARRHGAQIFCGVEVRYVERGARSWLVHYSLPGAVRRTFDPDETLYVEADVVVLAGGTLGSTEILLRSREHGLALSDRLGDGLSGNGDVLGFAYNGEHPVNAVGREDTSPADPVGPCITGIIDNRSQKRLEDGFVIEEGVLPGAFTRLYPGIFRKAAQVLGRGTDNDLPALMRARTREALNFVRDSYHGAMHHTQTYLVMAHDGADGRMRLEQDRLRVSWAGVGARGVFASIDDALFRAARTARSTFIKNPIWNQITGQRLVSVHPLGGCGMADGAERGVTNSRGQVFSSSSGQDVHEGLYVADGAVIPMSLGVNPLLTISAVAERTCALAAADRDWKIDYASTGDALPAPSSTVGVQFTERMVGHVADVGDGSFQQGRALGRKQGSGLSFLLTVEAASIDEVLREQLDAARLIGSVRCELLSPDPLMVHEGYFSLLHVDPQRPGARRMTYRMQLRSRAGEAFYLSGYKQVDNDSGFDVWQDTTTLYVTVYRGTRPEGSTPALRGILHIEPGDFARQLTTMRAIGGRGPVERLAALQRFSIFFGGALVSVYGGAQRVSGRLREAVRSLTRTPATKPPRAGAA